MENLECKFSLPEFPVAYMLIHVTPRICVIILELHYRRMRVIERICDEAMFQGVKVDVIQMPVEIILIADSVIPEAALPNGARCASFPIEPLCERNLNRLEDPRDGLILWVQYEMDMIW